MTFWLKLKIMVLASVALLTSLIAAYFRVKAAGRAEAEAKRTADRLKAVKARKEVDDAVGADSDPGPELSKWMRDNPKR